MASSVPLRLIDGIEKKTVTDFEVRTVRCGPGEKKARIVTYSTDGEGR